MEVKMKSPNLVLARVLDTNRVVEASREATMTETDQTMIDAGLLLSVS